MNCVELAIGQANDKPDELALWMPGPGGGSISTFGDLLEQATRIQGALVENRIAAGDTVLLVDDLGARLYATILAILSIGASVMLVEPWMPVRKIDSVVRLARPEAFVANLPGHLWGARVPAIRAIKNSLAVSRLARAAKWGCFDVASVEPHSNAILTFTSGTTGEPKGVVRTHEFLLYQQQALCAALGSDRFDGTDLCIFANFVLSNLAAGRGSILVPQPWRRSHLRQLDALPVAMGPESLTCGPGFLLRLMGSARVKSLRSINVGGALTDCHIFESGFHRWPDADWRNVYGSTEAEPVTVCDARMAVQHSKDKGYFQALFLGAPVPAIRSDLRENGLWVSGRHIGPGYVGATGHNLADSQPMANSCNWHFMGDRVRSDTGSSGHWWYAGRSSQPAGDFTLEQRAYSRLQSSKAFIHRTPAGEAVLVGENVGSIELEDVQTCVEAKIYRDARHRARIDRQQTLRRGAAWLLG